ncbi:DUF4349 domain-containing protein [Nocardioides sp. HDW12B]|uniref:DUF4349 domain-containing protein n=1 Tax=Nocardioides sp. HDW12B TaxID=2714939 RepID=UPI001407ED16|nr:DUF4349 domain-containing protein [Nocardioides sp. HDW12B]QIK66196.1 DUF4349 domain-containing protein [Nocardioides sp. HDW12B]
MDTTTSPGARGTDRRTARRRGAGRPALLLAAGLTTLTVLTGCSGSDQGAAGEAASGSDSGAGDLGSPDGSVALDSPAQAGDADAPDSLADEARSFDATGSGARATMARGDTGGTSDSTSVTGPAARVPVEAGLYIRTGRVTLVSDDLESARASLERTVRRYGGQVASEQTDSTDEGELRSSRLTLRVPSARFSTVMASFAELGAVQDSRTEQEEVTTEVIDVASRIRTQEVSLGRLRGFLDRATSVASVIRLESEIARREADLASLRAQQDYLADQTSYSTIELTLRAEEKDPEPAPTKEKEDTGFLAGLSGGWNALVDVLVVAATVLGALLPFALVVALVGLPLAVWLRTTRRHRRTPGEATPAT